MFPFKTAGLPLLATCTVFLFCDSFTSTWAAPVITEIMASNKTGILDEDGEAMDWLEIFNPDATPADLSGWRLTDDARTPAKWIFPSGVTLPPGGFLRVWASGKNRQADPAKLHTNFSLSADGEYLALLPPSGTVPASEFTPAFPALPEDESYGVPFETTILTAANAEAQILAPAAASPGWEQREFTPPAAASWRKAPLSAGFGMPALGFFVEERLSPTPITTIAAAEALFTGTNGLDPKSGLRPVLNFVSSGGQDGQFSGGIPFLHSGAPEQIAVRATATITLPAGGQWTFHVNSSDGFKLYLDGAVLMQFSGTREPADSFITRTIPSGAHALKLIYFGGAGGNEVELSAVQGSKTGFSDTFALIGDTDHGGLPALAPPDSGVSTVSTDLSAGMLNAASSAYIRVPFSLTDPAAVETLALSLAWNDGFVAWLNGTEVARRNAPAAVDAASAAVAARSVQESLLPEYFDLSAFRGRLTAGENVLAFQVLNASAADPSLFLAPQLSASRRVPGAWRYFRQTTPGFPNTAPGVLGHAALPSASPPRGYLEAPASVTLTTTTPGARIRYTTNGSAPTAATGTVYTGPVAVSKTTVLRAAAFLDGYETSPVATHTYLFLSDILLQGASRPTAEWPAAGTVNGQAINYGMNPVIVNHTNATLGGAASTIASLKSLPAVCVTMALPDLFDPTTGIYVNAESHGSTWERPGSMELIADPTTPEGGFQSGCGLRMRGGVSRRDSNPKHGWRVFFRNEYGAGKLHYPIYGGAGTDEFDAFDIQCAQNYSWSRDGGVTYNALREIWSRDTQLAMGQPATRGRFAHLYLNGIYWGLHQIQERADDSFGASYLGGDKDDYDVIKSAGLDAAKTVEASAGYFTTQPDGTDSAWKKLWSACRASYFICRDKNPATPAATLVSTPQEKLAAYYKIQGLQADGRTPTGGAALADMDNLIDYMVLLFFTKNSDSSVSAFYENARPNNFFCLRNRLGMDGFLSISHDAEHTLDAPGAADRWGPWQTDTGAYWNNINYSNPQYLHQDLSASGEYRIRFADRLHRHFHNNGALGTANNQARFDLRSAQIENAVIAESARWGDAQTSPTRTAADWRAARTATRNWFTNRNAVFLSEAKSRGFYPSIEPPALSLRGGEITPGQSVTLTNPNTAGSLFYTTDGSDPRPAGGGAAASPAARAYTDAAVISRPLTLKARVLNGNIWSALEEGTFTFSAVPAAAGNLVVSEFCYAPAGPRNTAESRYEASDFEFIEIQNISDRPVNPAGITFSQAVDFTLPATPSTALIPPGGRVVFSPNPDAFAARYGSLLKPVPGSFSGKLNNSGELLRLTAADGFVIKEFTWRPTAPWPAAAATGGHSLVLVNPASNPDHTKGTNWRTSALPDGQPGIEKSTPGGYAAWKAAAGITSETDDPWRLGLPALTAYGLGAAPGLPASEMLPVGGLISLTTDGVTKTHATLSFRFRAAAADLTASVESSSTLAPGSWAPAAVTLVSETPNPDGTATRLYRGTQPVNPALPSFLRVRFSVIP
ncbi:MAG: lamin tail domain-containing protein [Verrucomicrobiota bacterium]